MQTENRKRKVVLLDATLREGEQSAEINLNYPQKKKIIELLDDYGVEYIEIGYGLADVGLLKRLVDEFKGKLKNSKLAIFGSTKRKNVKASEDHGLKAILEINSDVVTLFGKSWLLHAENVLRLTAEENLELIYDSIKYLVDNNKEVVYDAEHFFDGYFNNREYALKTLEKAAEAGAKWLVLCDTIGGVKTSKIMEVVKDVKAYLDSKGVNAKLGIHCHNDKGMANANSIIAADYGCEMIQVTSNGFGERTGNADLFSIACSLGLDKELEVNVDIKKSVEISRAVYKEFGVDHNKKQPLVGKCAFAHKAGTHIDVLNKVGSKGIEVCEPSFVGNVREEILSDISGGASAVRMLKEFNVEVDKKDPRIREMMEEIKAMYNRGYDLSDKTEREILVAKYFLAKKDYFDIYEWDVMTGKKKDGKAISQSVVVDSESRQFVARIEGGPVDAQYKALQKMLVKNYPEIDELHLADFASRIAKFKEESSAVIVKIDFKYNGSRFSTEYVSDDILEAALRAIQKGFNYYLWKKNNFTQ